MACQDKRRLDILLLGKTGHGKSATGNSILGWKAFQAAASSTSVTSDVAQRFGERGDCVLTVVDAPGLGETRLDDTEKIEKAVKDLTRALVEFSEGFHVMLLVLKFGQRFTVEEQDTVDLLKAILGPDVFQKYGVCVMTHGDLFPGAMEAEGTPDMTPLQWCENQDSNFSGLFRECGSRFVLFDNRSKEESIKDRQMEELLTVIRKLPSNGFRYTCAQFERTRGEREKLIMKAKLPQMEQKLKEKCNLLEQDLEQIQLDNADAGLKLAKLKKKANDLIKEIDEDDKGTKILVPLKDIVISLKLTIETAETARRDLKEEALRKQVAELAKEIQRLAQKLQKEKQSLENDVKESGFLESLESVAKGIWAPPKYILKKIIGASNIALNRLTSKRK